MANLKQEILAVGKWNNMQFTHADLKSIAASFASLNNVLKVPLKLGHNDEQPVTDGQPALGWVTDVEVIGDKLVAIFDHVPDIMMAAFEAKRYRSVSVELDLNVSHKGTTYDFVLTAVALLGADMPAVNVLNDLGALLSRNSYLPQSDYVAGRQASFSSINGNIQETIMTPEEEAKLRQQLAEAQAKLTTEQANFAALQSRSDKEKEEADAKFAKLEAEQKATRVTAARVHFTTMLETEVSEKRITPAQREAFTKVLGIDDDDKVLALQDDDVKALFAATPDDKSKQSGTHQSDETSDNPSQDLTDKVYEHMTASGSKDFSASLEIVMRANPDLARDYIDSNGEVQ